MSGSIMLGARKIDAPRRSRRTPEVRPSTFATADRWWRSSVIDCYRRGSTRSASSAGDGAVDASVARWNIERTRLATRAEGSLCWPRADAPAPKHLKYYASINTDTADRYGFANESTF